jgi:uncharacterized phage protein gp47/JayE
VTILATLGPTLGQSGISIPAYADILESLKDSFRAIYGGDIYLEPDSQDGQMVAIFAQAIYDVDMMCVNAIMSFSPTYAQGAEFSSLVKINGIRRMVPTNSSAVGDCIGVAGTVIANGVVEDANGNLWDLPASVTIPIGGSISETVTAQEQGAIVAAAGTINVIRSPQYGWQSFASTTDATVGNPLESDIALRYRQSVSVGNPAYCIVSSMLGAIYAVPGVTHALINENNTSGTVNSVPAYNIAVVALGGSAQAIGDAIAARMPPGLVTYGAVTVISTDPLGVTHAVKYTVATEVRMIATINIVATVGYITAYGTALKQAMADYINGLGIGDDVQYARLFGPVAAVSPTIHIINILIAKYGGSKTAADVAIDYKEIATCAVADITLIIA